MISCSFSKKNENGCKENTVDVAWNKLRNSYNNPAGYYFFKLFIIFFINIILHVILELSKNAAKNTQTNIARAHKTVLLNLKMGNLSVQMIQIMKAIFL